MDEARRSDRTVFWGALIIVGAYMALSRLLTAWMGALPPEFSWSDWLTRFALRSLTIRPAAFAACLILAARHGGLGGWGWRAGRPLPAFLLAAIASAAFAGLYFARSRTADFSLDQKLLGWAAVVPVALFEETLFRGLLFLSLRPRLGPFGAAIASSALFTGYHIHGVGSWPSIFMFGFAACACAHAGLGLPWLVLLHAVVDAAWFLVGADFRLPVVRVEAFWGSYAVLYATCAGAIELLRRPSLLPEVGGRA